MFKNDRPLIANLMQKILSVKCFEKMNICCSYKL